MTNVLQSGGGGGERGVLTLGKWHQNLMLFSKNTGVGGLVSETAGKNT